MAGIGILLTESVVSDDAASQRFKFSLVREHAESGMTLRRQAGGVERAIAGVASSAEVEIRAERVTGAQYEWLVERLGRQVQLRMPTGFSAQVVVARLERTLVSSRSDTIAWGVNLVFYVIRRL